MAEKICLITGATDGIGRATAIRLAGMGYHIVIIARDERKVAKLMQEIFSRKPAARLDYIIADLSSLQQVNSMVQIFRQRYDQLDILINNAGVVMPNNVITEDGFEKTFQVNYLSPFIITNSLLPLLEKSEDGRVVNVTSSVYSLGKFNLETIHGRGRFNTIGAYSASKLYLLMFTRELAERLNGIVSANSMHPGIVKTNMSTQVQGFPIAFKLISLIAMPFAITPEKAAETAVFLAVSDSVQNISGKYFTNSKITKTKNKFDTPVNRRELWDQSIHIWESYKN